MKGCEALHLCHLTPSSEGIFGRPPPPPNSTFEEQEAGTGDVPMRSTLGLTEPRSHLRTHHHLRGSVGLCSAFHKGTKKRGRVRPSAGRSSRVFSS